MPALKLRHERFCRSYLECANATVAARNAGYAPMSARNTGYRLLRRPAILERLRELQHEIAQRECRETDIMLSKLEIVYRRAIDDRHFSAAARAVELQAKLAGAIAPRPQAKVAGRLRKRLDGDAAASVPDEGEPEP